MEQKSFLIKSCYKCRNKTSDSQVWSLTWVLIKVCTCIIFCCFLTRWFVYPQAMQKTEEEIARLKGHQNFQQKLQHLLAIKRENNALKEVRTLIHWLTLINSITRKRFALLGRGGGGSWVIEDEISKKITWRRIKKCSGWREDRKLSRKSFNSQW